MGERNYVLNASTPFVWGWKTIKNVLNDSGKAKTVLVGEETCEELKQIVCTCQLLQDFGGKARQPEKWWPPTVPPYCENHKQFK